MLVLTRKSGEIIHIGKGIEVKVLSISRSAVKLGFSAPADVVIRRQELIPPSKQSAPFNSIPPPVDVCLPLFT
jgi:carbon storage regulator CsrA